MAEEKLSHYKLLLENTYLGQWDLSDGKGGFRKAVGLVIERIERFEPERRERKKLPSGEYVDAPNKRVKVWFRGKKKAWLAGPESQKVIAGLYGPYVERWVGKMLNLYVDTEVAFGKKKVGGLRPENVVPRVGTPTNTDTLDQPVDKAKAAEIAAAVDGSGPGREPGED